MPTLRASRCWILLGLIVALAASPAGATNLWSQTASSSGEDFEVGARATADGNVAVATVTQPV